MRCANQLLLILLALALALAGLARAQMQHGAPQADVLDASALAQEIADAMKAAPPAPKAESAKATLGVVVERSDASTAAKKLAAAYPANARTEVERTFSALLVMYPQVEQKLGMPANELGGALALFLVTSLQAYQGRDAQIEQFKAVAAQMRGILSANPAIAKAPAAEKQELYEQLAILGMFLDGVHEALKKSPNPQIAANMKVAAKGYLQQFFDRDVDRLELGAQGLLVKGAQAQDGVAAKEQKPQRDAAEEEIAAATQDAPTAKNVPKPAPTNEPRPAPTGRRIEAVLLQQAWGMGIGGSLVLRYDPVVLYSDGSFTRDAESALTGEAKILKGWRKEGADYLVPDSKGKIAKIPAKMRARPAKPQQRITGRYTSFSGLGGGGTGTAMVAAYKNFNFAPDGTVLMDKGAGASTVGTEMPGDGSVVTHSKTSGAGRYSLDGYQITLSLGDDKEQPQLFYFFPDSDGVIGIGEGTYSNQAKK